MIGVVAKRRGDNSDCIHLCFSHFSEDDGSGRLSEIEPGAVGIKRPAEVGRQCLERLEAGDNKLRQYIGTDDHHIAETVFLKERFHEVKRGAPRNAGIADDDWFVGIAKITGNQLGGTPKVWA